MKSLECGKHFRAYATYPKHFERGNDHDDDDDGDDYGVNYELSECYMIKLMVVKSNFYHT